MKISFKESEDGLKNDIYVDDRLTGTVEINLWNQKWKVNPFFKFNPKLQGILYAEYSSCYKAGKALAKLYSDTFTFFDDEDITQEIDMRGIFKSFTP